MGAHFLASMGTIGKALPRRCGILDRLLRGINERPRILTLKTSLRLEQAIRNDSGWLSHDVYRCHEAKDEVAWRWTLTMFEILGETPMPPESHGGIFARSGSR
jgi:hypothetical protein